MQVLTKDAGIQMLSAVCVLFGGEKGEDVYYRESLNLSDLQVHLFDFRGTKLYYIYIDDYI